MENENAPKIKAYGFIDNRFKPLYGLQIPEGSKKIQNPLERLTIEALTYEKEPEHKEIKKHLKMPYEMVASILNGNSSDKMNEVWKKYQNCEIDERLLGQYLDEIGERQGEIEEKTRNIKYNIENSSLEIYTVPEAKELINTAKTLQEIRGGKPKPEYIKKVNEDLMEACQNFDTGKK